MKIIDKCHVFMNSRHDAFRSWPVSYRLQGEPAEKTNGSSLLTSAYPKTRRRASLVARRCGPALAAAALAAVASSPAPAQQVPQSAEPGQVQKRLTAPAAPRREPAPFARPVPEAEPRVGDTAARAVLTAVAIEGATVYEAEDLAALYEPYLAREIGLADIGAIVAAVTARYRADGYVLSRAVAPAQALELGILRIRVIEGYVERVTFAGSSPGRPGLLAAWADKITAVRPITAEALERYVLLIDDLPGVSADAALRRIDAKTGAYELILTLDHDPIDAFLYADNRGTRPIGPWQAAAGVSLNSALAMLERTRLTLFTVPDSPEELRFVELRHSQRVGTEGTTVVLAGSLSRIDAGAGLAGLAVESSGLSLSAGVEHPLVRARERSLYLTARFDYLDLDQDMQASRLFDDRLRVLRLGLRAAFADRFKGVNFVDLAASRGLDALGASPAGAADLSRLDGRSDFTKIAVEATRRQSLGEGWTLQVAVAGQKSADALLSAEEFALGGGRFGRAYDPSEITGDDGVAASIELQVGRRSETGVLRSWQLYGFYDAGRVWDGGQAGASDGESLTSAGIGVRADLFGRLSGSLEVAKPITRDVAAEGDRDARLFVSLTAIF